MKRYGLSRAPSVPFVTALGLLAVLPMLGCNRSAEEAYREVKEKAKAQGNAVQALRDQGAKLEEKAYLRSQKAWAVDLSGQQVSDETFDLLKKIHPIAELNFSKTNFSDALTDKLNDPDVCATILKLNLSNTGLADAGLEKLTHLFALQELVLTGTQVTAAGVDKFRQTRTSNAKIPALFRSPKIEF
jgi:hypothetical protein